MGIEDLDLYSVCLCCWCCCVVFSGIIGTGDSLQEREKIIFYSPNDEQYLLNLGELLFINCMFSVNWGVWCRQFCARSPQIWLFSAKCSGWCESTRTRLPILLKTSQNEEKQPKVAHTSLLKREKKWR